MIDAKTAFGILADGSDETAKIAAALAAGGDTATGDEVYFGPGVYGVNNLPAIDYLVSFRGAGINKTIFKNLSATARMFELVGTVGADWNTAFARIGGFTVDQNGSAGNGIELNTMFSGLYDIWLKNQAGSGFAIRARNLTQGKLDNIHVSSSTNGIWLDSCLYSRLDHCSVERSSGVGIKMTTCAALDISSLYLDHGNSSSVGSSAPELMQITDCTTVNIHGFYSEIATAATLSPLQFFKIHNSSNVNILGGRINHMAVQAGSHYIFYCSDSSVSIRGIDWFEQQNGMVFAGVNAANDVIALRDIVTYISATGSRYGLGCWDGKTKRVIIENWTDRNLVPDSYVNAADMYIAQNTSNTIIEVGSTKRTLFNCSGGVGGSGAAGAYAVNC